MQRWVARHFQPTCVPNLAHSAISRINSYYRNHDPLVKNISYGSKVKLIWGVSKNQGGLETFLSLFFSFQKFAVRILAQMTPFQPSVVRVYRLAACTQHFLICSSNTNELMFERVWGTENSFIDRQPNQKKGQNAPNLATPSGPI